MIHCSACGEPVHPAPTAFPPLCGECEGVEEPPLCEGCGKPINHANPPGREDAWSYDDHLCNECMAKQGTPVNYL